MGLMNSVVISPGLAGDKFIDHYASMFFSKENLAGLVGLIVSAMDYTKGAETFILRRDDLRDDVLNFYRDFVEIVLDDTKSTPKKQHDVWVQRCLDAGWHYGEKFDSEDMTHPEIRGFSKASESWRFTCVVAWSLVTGIKDIIEQVKKPVAAKPKSKFQKIVEEPEKVNEDKIASLAGDYANSNWGCFGPYDDMETLVNEDLVNLVTADVESFYKNFPKKKNREMMLMSCVFTLAHKQREMEKAISEMIEAKKRVDKN